MRILLLSTAVAIMSLSGCTVGTGNADRRIQGSIGAADTALDRFASESDIRSGGVQLSDRPFVAAQRETGSSANRLPASVRGANAVHLQSRDPMGLPDIAARLTEITGIPHVLAMGPAGQVVTGSVPGGVGDGGAMPSVTPAGDGAASGQSSQLRIRPNLRGPLSSVLDEISATFELEWSFRDGRVILRDFVTRQYQIAALPFTETISADLSNNNLSASAQASTDIWGEISEAVENILSDGSSVSFGQSTGTITITARVSDHARVADFIRATNERVGQQVAFDVNVITVVLNSENALGIDLSAAIANSGISVDVVGRPPSQAGFGSVNIGVARGAVNISALAQALARYGQVSVETRAGTTTANNRVAPIEVTETIAYLSGVTREAGTNGGPDRFIPQTDRETTGFQMQLMPRILNTREIMVQYAVRISELNNLRTFGTGSDTIQLPEIATTAFQQQAIIQNGQTLIMAGFERRRVERSGANGGSLLRLARSEQVSSQRVATVLLITPTILRR